MRNRAENQINLILIRHGETASNSSGRYLGRTDEELSGDGKAKLLINQAAGRYPKAELVFSSPMKRCIQTSELIYDCRSPILIEEWREMDFGRFEGKNYQELNGDTQYQAWIDSNGSLPFPEGESREQFALRCQKGFRKLLGIIQQELQEKVRREVQQKVQREVRREIQHEVQCQIKCEMQLRMQQEAQQIWQEAQQREEITLTAAAVIHGGSIMALLSAYCGGDYFDYRCKNGEGYLCCLKLKDSMEFKLTIIRKL